MTATTQSAEADLAFMRALVSSGEGMLRGFGWAYFAAGLCYSVQILLAAGQTFGTIPSSPAWGIPIGFGPTAVFLVILTWILVTMRSPPVTGSAARTIGLVFGSVGLANLALVAVVGLVSWREKSLTTWLIYPCCVFVLQGMAWMIAYGLRRRAWNAWVAAGWVLTAVTMAWTVQKPGDYILAAGVGLLLFMTVPGAVMIRLSRRAG